MGKWVASATLIVTAAFAFASVPSLGAQQVSPAQFTSGLGVPFTTSGTGQSGSVPVSGVFRITQFLEQGGRAYAAGTLAIGVGDATAPHTFVRQVIVPVLNVRSASTFVALTLALGPATATPGSFAGFNMSGNTTGSAAGGTLFGNSSSGTTSTTGSATGSAASTGTSGTTAATGTTSQSGVTTVGSPNQSAVAGVAASAVPGSQANCGPFQVAIGPIDEAGSTLSFHLDRLVLEIAAPVGVVSTASSLMCSADAALSAAANASVSATGLSNSSTFGSGATGTTSTGTGGSTLTTAIGSTIGTSGTGNATSATGTGTPLQSLVGVLNQLVGAL